MKRACTTPHQLKQNNKRGDVRLVTSAMQEVHVRRVKPAKPRQLVAFVVADADTSVEWEEVSFPSYQMQRFSRGESGSDQTGDMHP
jgi:hypothetical protein